MDLSDLKSRLNNEGNPPTARIASTLKAIALAQDQGGEILYLTPNEKRMLSEGWAMRRALAALVLKVTKGGGIEGNPWCCEDVKAAAQALADFEAVGDKYSVDLEQIANPPCDKPALKTWQCPRCNTVKTVSAVYDEKICMDCGVKMVSIGQSGRTWGPILGSGRASAKRTRGSDRKRK